MRNASGLPYGSSAFAQAPMGGGGYVTGGSIAADASTIAVGMDVFNAYVRRSGETRWSPLFTPSTLQTAEYDPKPNNGALVDEPGCAGIAVAPSDGTRVYAAWNGYFYRFDYSGGAWAGTRCNLTAKRLFANSGSPRYWNDKIAVHPTDKATALFGTTNDGVYYTTNSGSTMTAVAGTIPANSTSGGYATPYLVAIAPNGTDCYIVAQGTGIYKSTTGVSGTFTLMSGSPTFASCLVVAPNGDVWVCDPTGTSGSNVSKYSGGLWASVTIAGIVILSVAINPLDTTKMAAVNPDGARAYSTDSGANFTVLTSNSNVVSTDIPWLNGNRMYMSKIFFDPVTNNRLWGPNGVGVAYCTAGTWDWVDTSVGIEELVASNGLSIPGKTYPILLCWDKPIWKKRDLAGFSDRPKFVDNIAGVWHAWQADYAIDDTDYIAVCSNYNGAPAGYSQNAGDDFASFANQPLNNSGGGAIAVSNKNQIIYIPGNNGRASCTEDGGATPWSYLPIDPNISGQGNWVSVNYNRRNCVTADKTRPGVFAVVMNGINQGTGVQGIWVTTTGPLGTWTHTVSGQLDSTGNISDFWHCDLKYIPGKSGELLYTSGKDYNSRIMHFTGDGLTTAKVDVGAPYSITKVHRIGFGKAAPGQSYPTVFFYGQQGGVMGLYRTCDFFATAPVLLARFPNGSLDFVNTICGDMNIFGRAYIGGPGSAWRYCDYADRATAT